MERIRDTITVALIALVERLRKDRPHLADAEAAVEQARSEIADRAQAVLSSALRQPALADLIARVPITAIASVAVEERRRSRRQTILLALALAGVSTALAFAATAIIRRYQAQRARSTMPADRALTTTPPKELVAIPIETPAAEPVGHDVEAVDQGQEDEEERRFAQVSEA
jgi:hypothetical protein